MTELHDAFTSYASKRLGDCCWNIKRCVNLLTSEQVWQRPNDVSNSIGNLVLHLTGNVRQWILCGLGGEVDQRNRPAEFAQRDPLDCDEIVANLNDVVSRACAVIEQLGSDDLIKEVAIQGYSITGLAAVFHVVEHFSLHTGQVVYATKLQVNRDLSLYDSEGQRIDGRSMGTP